MREYQMKALPAEHSSSNRNEINVNLLLSSIRSFFLKPQIENTMKNIFANWFVDVRFAFVASNAFKIDGSFSSLPIDS